MAIEILELCPWCGAKEDTRYERKMPHYRHWGCGSKRVGIEPIRSMDCELNCAEIENEKLKSEYKILRFERDKYKFHTERLLAELEAAKDEPSRLFNRNGGTAREDCQT